VDRGVHRVWRHLRIFAGPGWKEFRAKICPNRLKGNGNARGEKKPSVARVQRTMTRQTDEFLPKKHRSLKKKGEKRVVGSLYSCASQEGLQRTLAVALYRLGSSAGVTTLMSAPRNVTKVRPSRRLVSSIRTRGGNLESDTRKKGGRTGGKTYR